MKRRDFISTAVGLTAGSVLMADSSSAQAEDRPKEKRGQVYACRKCNTVVEILEPGRSSLTHCGQPMELLEEQTADATQEKHVPIIEKVEGGYKVIVGSKPHPMTDEHWIVWIELLANGRTYRQFLNPGDKPEAFFPMAAAENVAAREFCNLHGLWEDA